MAKDKTENSVGFKSQPNPPVTPREVIAKQKVQVSNNPRDNGFASRDVETPPLPPTPEEIEAAQKRQDAHKIDLPKSETEKFNESLDKVKEDLKNSQENKKSELTAEQQNAINFLNSITPIDSNSSPASLQALRDQIKEAAKLLPVGYKNIANAVLSSITSVINQSENNQVEHNPSTNKQWTPEEIQTSLNTAENNKTELAKQAEEVDKLWDTVNSKEHKQKQEEFDLKDEERNKKLKPFLTKESLTEEDLREAKKHQLTDEEIEERKSHWNNISAAYHGLKDLTTNIAKESKRLDEEIKQLNELEHKEDHHHEHIKELSKHKDHHDKNLDKYNKTLSEAEKEYKKKDQKLADLYKELEEAKHSPNEVLIQEILNHLKVYEKDHEKDFAKDPNSKDAKIYTKIKEALNNHHDEVAAASKEAEEVRKQSNDTLPSNNKTQQSETNITENNVLKQAESIVKGVKDKNLNPPRAEEVTFAQQNITKKERMAAKANKKLQER